MQEFIAFFITMFIAMTLTGFILVGLGADTVAIYGLLIGFFVGSVQQKITNISEKNKMKKEFKSILCILESINEYREKGFKSTIGSSGGLQSKTEVE